MGQEIYIVRHGESEGNAGLPSQNHREIPLTEKGKTQAQEIPQHLPWEPELIVISPFLRARQTAQPTLDKYPDTAVEIWPEVREFTYLMPKKCTGTTTAQRRPWVEAYWSRLNPFYIDGEGAESFFELVYRASETLRRIQNSSKQKILIFSHEQFIKVLTDLVERPLGTVEDRMERFNRLPRLGNCEGRLLQYDAGKLQNTRKERYTVKDILDLTCYREITNTFGGSGKKKKIIFNDRTYMVKFPVEANGDSPFSEDTACKIYKLLGYPAQNTFLANYTTGRSGHHTVAACEDFTEDGSSLLEFSKLCLADGGHQRETRREIKTIMGIIDRLPIADGHCHIDKESIKKQFLDMVVIDGFLGNPKRKLDDWGLLEDRDGNLAFAPLYDCASSLSASLTDEQMAKILSNEPEFAKRERNNHSFYDRLNFAELPALAREKDFVLNDAICRITPKIERSLAVMFKIIDAAPRMSEIRKKYLQKSLQLRFDQILRPAFQAACSTSEKHKEKDYAQSK